MLKNYRIRGGLHGVGILTVNALSSEVVADISRSGYLWRQTYSEGIPTSLVEQIRPLAEGVSAQQVSPLHLISQLWMRG